MMKLTVKEVAEAKGIHTAKALSVKAGIPYASVHRIWNGTVTMLALDTIERLCRALGVQPGMLMMFIDTDAIQQGDPSQGATDTLASRRERKTKARRSTKAAPARPAVAMG
jgi:DNA-binding Xre family transcriptional regulator